MMQTIAVAGILFLRNLAGIITRPYQTYRRIVTKGSLWELGYIGGLVGLYLATATVVKNPYFRPFFLTRQYIVLLSATGCTFCFVVGLCAIMGKLFKSSGTLRALVLGWGYSMVPTLTWFWITSILYIVLPPPRTTGFLGIAFSVVYLLFSAVVFFWKIILAYLTIRFALRFDFKKIVTTCAVGIPLLGIYSVAMYRLGIFKVPFI
jgi:hypothetical protein